MTAPRALRIALAVAGTVPHPAACRLGADLEAWASTPAAAAAERARALGVPPAALAAALALRPGAASAAAAAERAAAARGAVLITAGEAGFPAALAALDLPPPALWIAGAPPAGPAVALVGARKASRYGLEIAGWLARGLAQGGATVVSGFAIGVDAAAHRGALAEPAGRTVAVLGTGLDVDYPRGHRELGERIRAQGALVTEFPPRLGPRRWQFPVRNRLIAALADAVVVVEAAPRSGSLVTARLALDLGRDLYAVPGRLTDELALGTNALLGAGAAPALGPADLLERLGLDAARCRPPEPGAPPPGLAGAARALWLAAEEPAAAEALAARVAISIDRALAALLELEIEGHVRRLADARYVQT